MYAIFIPFYKLCLALGLSVSWLGNLCLALGLSVCWLGDLCFALGLSVCWLGDLCLQMVGLFGTSTADCFWNIL